MRWAMATGAMALGLLAGCTTSSTGGDGVACTSHYAPIADAQSRAALKAGLLKADARVHSLRVIDDDRPTKVTVNLLNAKRRVVMSLDMWRKADGTWTAQQWSQCID